MAKANPAVQTVEHPLIARSLTILRDASTDTTTFRRHLKIIAQLMTPAATVSLATKNTRVQTPLEETEGSVLTGPVIVAPILRAGIGMVDGLLEMIPDATVAHIGLCRDESTLEPKVYYQNYPSHLSQSHIILVDPMLATGGSSIAAATLLKDRGASSITFLNLVSCPAGIDAFHAQHPDIAIVTAAVDQGLDDRAYIVPGLGDAGDRYFGT